MIKSIIILVALTLVGCGPKDRYDYSAEAIKNELRLSTQYLSGQCGSEIITDYDQVSYACIYVDLSTAEVCEEVLLTFQEKYTNIDCTFEAHRSVFYEFEGPLLYRITEASISSWIDYVQNLEEEVDALDTLAKVEERN